MKRKINCIMFVLPTSKGAASLVGRARGASVASAIVKAYQKVYTLSIMGIIGSYLGHCPWAIGGVGVCVGGALVSAPGASRSIKAY